MISSVISTTRQGSSLARSYICMTCMARRSPYASKIRSVASYSARLNPDRAPRESPSSFEDNGRPASTTRRSTRSPDRRMTDRPERQGSLPEEKVPRAAFLSLSKPKKSADRAEDSLSMRSSAAANRAGQTPIQGPRTRPDWKYLPDWRRQTLSIKHKIAQQTEAPKAFWNPPKKLSPDAMVAIRVLHKQHPEYDLTKLAVEFEVSPEVIRRILKSKWQPTAQEAADRDARWKKRKYAILDAQKQKALDRK